MNKKRRELIGNSIRHIEELLRGKDIDKDNIEKIRGDIEILLDEEQYSFDNMPENLRSSLNGMNSEEAIENLENAVNLLLEENINSDLLEEIINCLLMI